MRKDLVLILLYLNFLSFKQRSNGCCWAENSILKNTTQHFPILNSRLLRLMIIFSAMNIELFQNKKNERGQVQVVCERFTISTRTDWKHKINMCNRLGWEHARYYSLYTLDIGRSVRLNESYKWCCCCSWYCVLYIWNIFARS